MFSDGSRAAFRFEACANPLLARDLLAGLVELIYPHGTVDAAGTVQQYALALRNMVSVLAGWGFTGGADALTRGRLAQYWMGTTASREACTRRMLHAFDTATDSLADGVREFVAGRYYNQQPNRRPLPPYREGEWTRLTSACRMIVDEAFAAHKRALAAAAAGQHPDAGGWTGSNLRWLLARTGPVNTAESPARSATRHRPCVIAADSTTRACNCSRNWTWSSPTGCCSASTPASSPTASTTWWSTTSTGPGTPRSCSAMSRAAPQRRA